jgi:hypothetical protein
LIALELRQRAGGIVARLRGPRRFKIARLWICSYKRAPAPRSLATLSLIGYILA